MNKTISSFEKLRLEEEMKQLESDLPHLLLTLNETRSDGDFRENEPYQLARDAYNKASSRLSEILDILGTKTVSNPFGGTIVPGRLLKITYQGEADSSGNMIGDSVMQEFILLFSDSGESVISGILAKDSDLGKLIDNGREGRYFLSRGRSSLIFDIEFLGEDAHTDFLKKFPINEREKISSLLQGSV